MYVPDPIASGMDTFTYAANDCPTSPQSWSLTGTVSVNIVPLQTLSPINVTRYNDNFIDFSKWSVNSVDSTIPLNFTITSLPSIGKLSYYKKTDSHFLSDIQTIICMKIEM